MTPEQFCYWLQGYAEMNGGTPDIRQWDIIKDHLNLVFEKKTFDRTDGKSVNIDRGTTIDIQPHQFEDYSIFKHDGKMPPLIC